MSSDPVLIPFETVVRAIRTALDELPGDLTDDQAVDVLYWEGQYAELRSLAEELTPPVEGMGARVRELLTPANRCRACDGSGERWYPGFYVPSEFVEPPHAERCEDCLGTGSGEVAIRLAALESRVEQLEDATGLSTSLDPAYEYESLRELAARAARFVAEGRKVLPEDGQALLDLVALLQRRVKELS